MNDTSKEDRHLTLYWIALVAATLATYLIGELGAAGPAAMAAMLVITLWKGRAVARAFMGLANVKFLWRALVIGWLVLTLILVSAAYLLALR